MKQNFISILVITLSLFCLPKVYGANINTPLFATFEDGTSFPFVLNQDGPGSDIRTQSIVDNPLKEKNITNKCIEVDLPVNINWWDKTYLKIEDGTVIIPASDNHKYLHFYVMYPSGGDGAEIGVFNTAGELIYQKELNFESSTGWNDVVFDLSADPEGKQGIIGNNIAGIWIRPYTEPGNKCYFDQFELSDVATPRGIENLWNDPMLATFEGDFDSPFTYSIEGGDLNSSANNPDVTGVNNSAKVLHGDYTNGTDWWHKIKLEAKAGYLILPNTTDHKYLHFLSYRNVLTESELQVYDAANTRIFQKKFTNSQTNTWEEIVLDLTDSDENLPGIERKEISNIYIMVNVGAGAGVQHYYYDYFTLTDKATPISEDASFLGEVTIGEATITYPTETTTYNYEVAYGTDTYPLVSAANGTGRIESVTQANAENKTATIFAITPDEAIRAGFNIYFTQQPVVTTPSGDIPLTQEAIAGLTTITLKGDVTDNYITLLNNASVNITSIDIENVLSISAGLSPANPNCLIYTNTPYRAKNVITNGVAEEILLEDGYAFNNPETFSTALISYKRTYPKSGWSSFCLPFDMETKEGMIIKEFIGSEGSVINFKDAGSITANTPYLSKIPEDGLTIEYTASNETANIIVPATIPLTINPDDKEYAFCNSFSTISGQEVSGLYLLMENGEGFAKAASGAKVLPFRGYIKYMGTDPQPVSQLAIQFDDDLTEINPVTKTTDEISYLIRNGELEITTSIAQTITIYTADGRTTGSYQLNTGTNLITGLSKGIYLLNNQKIVIY